MFDKIFDKVIFIEDKEKEISPLIKILNQNNIFWKIYNSDKRGLPKKPFTDVSFLFLDLNLTDFNTTNIEKNMTSSLVPVINKIISKDNCPYLCVVWTSQGEHSDFLNTVSINKKPISFITMNKGDYFSNNFKKFNLKKFKKDLLVKIEDRPAFIFSEWWKKSNQKAQQKTLSLLFDIEAADWNKEAYKIIEVLANCTIGQHSKKTTTKNGKIPDFIVEAAGQTLGDILKDDLLDSYDLPIKLNRIALTKAEKKIESKILDKMNFKLYFSSPHSQIDYPGNLIVNNKKIFDFEKVIEKILLNNAKTKQSILEEINNDREAVIVFSLIVTPLCDHVQNKNKYVQVIPFIFIEKNFATQKEVLLVNEVTKDFHKIKAPGYCESLPREFFYNNKVYVACYDMSFKKTISLKDLRGKKAKLRIKSQLLIKIQKDLANHLSRIPLIEPASHSAVNKIFTTKETSR